MTLLKKTKTDWAFFLRDEMYPYIDGFEHSDKDVAKHCEKLAEEITNTVTAVLDEIEREVEEHGNKVLGLYGGRLPYTFFGGNEEDNRMQIYLAAHKDIIKAIIKSKRTEV